MSDSVCGCICVYEDVCLVMSVCLSECVSKFVSVGVPMSLWVCQYVIG